MAAHDWEADLRDRLANLERRVLTLQRRTWTGSALAIFILLMILVVLRESSALAQIQEAKADKIRVSGLELVDSKGVVRAKLLTEEGRTALTLNQASGKSSLVLNVSDDGAASISHYSNVGNLGLTMATSPKGTPLMMFYDPSKADKCRIMFGMVGTSPSLILGDENGGGRLLLSFFENSVPHIQFNSAKQESLIDLSLLDGTQPVILVGGEKDTGVASMSVDKGIPSFNLVSLNPKLGFRWTLSDQQPPSLLCTDSEKNVLMKLPNR